MARPSLIANGTFLRFPSLWSDQMPYGTKPCVRVFGIVKAVEELKFLLGFAAKIQS